MSGGPAFLTHLNTDPCFLGAGRTAGGLRVKQTVKQTFAERLILLLGGTGPGLQCHPPDLEALSVRGLCQLRPHDGQGCKENPDLDFCLPFAL